VRIAILAPPHVPVPPPAYGGTEAVLHGLACGLQTAGHDVVVVTTGDASCPVRTSWCFEEAVGVGMGGPIEELKQVVHGYQHAEEWGADIVHDHTLVGPLYALSGTALPVVTTNHGPFTAPELASLYEAVSRRVGIIAISHHQASMASPATPIAAVIHHGIAVDEQFGDGHGGYALFLGRMHPTKGVETAIRIARRAGVRLVIAAKMREAAEIAYFEREVEPHLGPEIEFVGEVGGEQKAALLRDAAALLNPIAWHEPFGMVMIEALAAGTPVVATPMGSVPEIVDDGVTGFVRASERDLAVSLLRAGELDRGACHRAARQRFSLERMVADHVALYERVAGVRAPDAVLR
jgi:glycosyltransferase involved in cell wall biosynthesis